MVRVSFIISGEPRMKPIKDPFLCVPRSLGVCLYRCSIINVIFSLSINNFWFLSAELGTHLPKKPCS